MRTLIVLVALYAATGFFVLPLVVKWQLEQRLPEQIGRPVSIGKVRVNPFALSVALERVVVRAADGVEPLASWSRFYVNFDALESIRDEWVLGEVSLVGLTAAVEVKPDGSLNFSDIIEKLKPPVDAPLAPEEPGRPWRIHRLHVADARVNFSDQSQAEPFQSEIGPVNVTLTNFRTAGAGGAPGRFEAVSEAGEQLTWTGTLTAVPLASAGDLRVSNLLLSKYSPYLAGHLNGEITGGRLSAGVSYEIDLSPEHRRLAVTDGAAQLQEFRLTAPDGRPVAEVNKLELTGLAADGAAGRVAAEELQIDGGRVAVERASDGTLNLTRLVPKRKPASGAPAKRPDLTVKEIAVRDFAVDVRDEALPTPAEFGLTQVNASVVNFTLERGAAMPVELTFGWAPRGTVRISGNVTPDPLVADLAVEAAWLELPPLSGYLEKVVQAKLASGAATLNGHARMQLAGGAPPNITFTGAGRLEELKLVDARDGAELAGLGELSVDDVKLASAPRFVLSIAEVTLGAPVARVVRAADGAFNWSNVLSQDKETASASDGVAADTRPRADLTITRVLLNGGEVTFVDESVEPQARMTVAQATGTLRNFSSLHPELGSVELRAVVNGTGPLTVTGRLNPLSEPLFADVLVDGKQVDLMPVAPYVAKYAGHALERGTLFLDVRARLAGEKVDMQNAVTLDQFTLGEPTPNPAAVKLPVKFGVALLKDAEGKIVLNIPVQGSLADPQFQIGKVAGQVVTGLLTKAATSPFTLLGSMFGGGDEDLSRQEFEPGQAKPTPESQRRIETLQRALIARPALQLEIEGGVDPAMDGDALKQRKLEALIRQRWAGAETEPSAEVPPRDRMRLVSVLYLERLAGDSPRGEARPMPSAAPRELPPARPKAAEPPEEKRGLVKRAWDMATLKGARDWWSGRKERAAAEERARAEEQARAAEQARLEAEARTQAANQRTPAPDLPVEEMERRLVETLSASPEDLRALARERAQRVRELLLADGKIAPERIRILDIADEKTPPRAGATLHLR